ncbi:superoxide dismutase [Candidatus Woesearchaeota archaeon]|nr:superoxide dismutase [Candidatus Woesearchaeota archaeon]
MTEEIKLPYAYDALEPFIDKETMQVHHDKHYIGYRTKYATAVKGTEFEGKCACCALRDLSKVPENIRAAVRNNGGGQINHKFFWKLLKKDVPFDGPIKDAIEAKWGSFDKFKEEFSNAAATLFGSGWTWLVKDGDELKIIQTPNQDSPISQGMEPILGLDVWEHAYYLKYQNRRPEYIEAFWSVINWEQVNHNLKKSEECCSK